MMNPLCAHQSPMDSSKSRATERTMTDKSKPKAKKGMNVGKRSKGSARVEGDEQEQDMRVFGKHYVLYVH